MQGVQHVVVRASRELDEQAAIDLAFGELREDVRAKLARDRMRHRATAVLLHEIGHTLGAIHARDSRDLMHPQYDTHMEAFGAGSAALMRATLGHRDDADRKESAQALLAALAGEPEDTWIATDREPFEARLHAIVDATSARAPATAPETATDKPMPPEIAALPSEARALFVEASRALDAGNPEAALAKARPLFASEPGVYAVQDLRCRIALARGVDWTLSRAECDALMKLSTGKTKSP